MSLAELQRAFQAHLLDQPSAFDEMVAHASRRGVPVYHHAYRATLRSTLRDTYARTALWLGDEPFDEVVDRFIAVERSRSWTLADYGTSFPVALDAAFPDDPEVGELAWLERALAHAFTSAARPPLAPEALPDIDWETVRFALQPSIAARRVRSDVAGIWHALGEARAPDAVLLTGETGVVVWREELTSRFRMTVAVEADALAMLADDGSFAALCARLGERGVTPEAIGPLLQRWLPDGLLALV